VCLLPETRISHILTLGPSEGYRLTEINEEKRNDGQKVRKEGTEETGW
jgi:hypothetical protein